jgi:4-hydroxy-tetrahydrodipicolinate synthase
MLRGSLTALVTPFEKGGRFDEKAFRAFVEWQVAEGTRGLVPVGTTGESPTLSHEEHRRVVEICVETARGRVPVIAGAGSNNTTEAIALAQYAEKVGADAVLVVTPYYNKPNQRGLYAHFAAVARATRLPIFIYNIPPRSIIDMTPETMGRLARDFTNIVGVKDATAKVDRVSDQRATCGADFIQLSGDRDRAIELQDRLMPLHRALFIEPNPAGPKYALSRLGRMENAVRSPMVPVEAETASRIDAAMKHAGLIN